ncbi:hypothetical protein H5410_024161 [Solanum commersonii]|uniref:Endonuclease/exonuclease/phosphatase domain-containing protein n=1 Tax=Solanum commersonii TaxID=4109 RepID=A0A9J5ZL82_SOLCO|nr:hypothetical protein H5410_024161 [Solanum commersonii]
MIKAIFWNIRGIRTKKANHRLQNLIKFHKVDFVAIFEPLLNMIKIDKYMKYFGYQHSISNLNGQIWLFWDGNFSTSIIDNTEQQITIKMPNIGIGKDIYITAGPWCISGDFNVILDPNEKVGGRPHRMTKSYDFSSCMDACKMSDLGFNGLKFTWCNNRIPRKRIWKRLDRCFDNHQNSIQYFKFLDIWIDQPSFMNIVKDAWNTNITVNAQWILKQILKVLSKKLSTWSKDIIGNVFDHVKEWEIKMKDLEDEDLSSPTEFNREELNKRQAEYYRWMNL